MTFQQLRYIHAIAKYGSFNEAARQLFVSQSSISAAVKDLETELGIPIFIRGNRCTEISPQGQEFLQYSSRLLGLLEEISDRYSSAADRETLFFSVSSQYYLFVEDAFVEFVSCSPKQDYRFFFWEGTLAQVLDNVSGFRSEVGVIFLSKYNEQPLGKLLRNRQLEFHSLARVYPSIFIRQGHPLAGREWVTYADLESYPFVLFETDRTVEGTGINDLGPLRKRKQSICVSERSTLLEVIAQTDAYNIGSGLLSRKHRSQFTSVPIKDDEDAFMDVGWICRGDRELSPIALRFIQLVQRVVEEYQQARQEDRPPV